MELWDSYDQNCSMIPGETLVRGEKVPEGRYHLVCEILLRHRDGTVLLMQRDVRKHFGGLWEASAGGSALKGECPVDCARRELLEETGVSVESLTEVGRVIHHERRTIYVEFLAETAADKNTVTLQPGETQAFRWVRPEELPGDLFTRRIWLFVDM